jgi:hypothetical protein
MMRMLEEGGLPVLTDRLRAADEDNPNGYYEYEPVKKTRQDPSWVAAAVGQAVKMVHLLLLDLPPGYAYRVVFMRRDLDEVIRSQDRMLQRLGRSAEGLPAERLAELYRSQIARVLAHLRAREEQFRLIEVDYNAIMNNARPVAGEISQFLDGLDTDRMVAAIDPKLYRVRRATPPPTSLEEVAP